MVPAVDAALPDQTFPARIFRWMQPEQVAKSSRAVLFSGRTGCFIAKYSFAALLILRNNVAGESRCSVLIASDDEGIIRTDCS